MFKWGEAWDWGNRDLKSCWEPSCVFKQSCLACLFNLGFWPPGEGWSCKGFLRGVGRCRDWKVGPTATVDWGCEVLRQNGCVGWPEWSLGQGLSMEIKVWSGRSLILKWEHALVKGENNDLWWGAQGESYGCYCIPSVVSCMCVLDICVVT